VCVCLGERLFSIKITDYLACTFEVDFVVVVVPDIVCPESVLVDAVVVVVLAQKIWAVFAMAVACC
jgi:hypothetical protein